MKRCQVERIQDEGFQVGEERMKDLTRFCRFSDCGAVGLRACVITLVLVWRTVFPLLTAL